jgi:hypothetical protein
MKFQKINVVVKKTIQESQYEPYSIELSAECSGELGKEDLKQVHADLEQTMDELMEARLQNVVRGEY